MIYLVFNLSFIPKAAFSLLNIIAVWQDM